MTRQVVHEAPRDGVAYIRQDWGWVQGLTQADINTSLDGKVDVAGDTMTGALTVEEQIVSGSQANAASGSSFLRGRYISGHLNILGSQRSSGSTILTFGLQPSSTVSNGYESSTSVTIGKSVFELGQNTFAWKGVASGNLPVGTAVVPVTHMTLDDTTLDLNANVAIDFGSNARGIRNSAGNYASFEAYGTKGAFGGMSVPAGDHRLDFISNGTIAGIFNDTDSQWMIQGTANGAVRLYQNGTNVVRTHVGGIDLAPVSANPFLGAYTANYASRLGFIQFSSAGIVIRSETHGAPVALQAEDNAGVARPVFNGDPDSGINMYVQGGERLRVVSNGIMIFNIVNATSDANAAVAGVSVGGVYRNGSDLRIRVT